MLSLMDQPAIALFISHFLSPSCCHSSLKRRFNIRKIIQCFEYVDYFS